jgi:hypothetical protein
MNQIEIANREIERLKKITDLMRKLATNDGFYHYYVSRLGKHKNNRECFEEVNDLFFELFGEYKYSSYGSFKSIWSRIHKHRNDEK